jgi:hypothetical protein
LISHTIPVATPMEWIVHAWDTLHIKHQYIQSKE